MNKIHIERIQEVLNKLYVIDEIEKDFDGFKNGTLSEGEKEEYGDFHAVVLTSNDCKLTLPYSYLSDALRKYRQDIASEIKEFGYDGPELDKTLAKITVGISGIPRIDID